MTEATARHALPLIQPGQAQKELSHNEALAALDLLVQPSVVAVGLDTPPTSPTPGQCWIVGGAPIGAWAGHAQSLAGWTDGGWRFAAPVPGMAIWTGGAAAFVRWDGGTWVPGALAGSSLSIAGQQVVGARAGAIADPSGGGAIDSEARATVTQILSALRQHGLIAP